MLFISCKSDLDGAIHSAVRDGVISSEEWNEIVREATSNQIFIDENGIFSTSLLQDYIREYVVNNMRGVNDIQFSEDIVLTPAPDSSKSVECIFKFFLERSGSMIPYDERHTSGQFKSAITGLLNSVPNNTIQFITGCTLKSSAMTKGSK